MTRITRRRFLSAAGLTMAGSFLAPRLCLPEKQEAKKLFMYNIHTGEYLKLVYAEGGKIVSDALAEVNTFFRDRLTNEQIAMDPALLNLIHTIHQETKPYQPMTLVSGYRCPSTNAYLRTKSKGVAKKSYHTQGMAADIFMSGVDLSKLKKLACSKGAGGVGYYPKSGFIHVDVRPGQKKRW